MLLLIVYFFIGLSTDLEVFAINLQLFEDL